MKPLPTLWVNPIESTGNARSGTWTRDPGDTTTRPYVARAEHVPASALDAANEALRVERAENKRLRAAITKTADDMAGGWECWEECPHSEGCPSACPGDDLCEVDRAPGEAAPPHDHLCPLSVALRLRAALSPRSGAKES